MRPPKLFLGDRNVGIVTVNPHINARIDPEVFLTLLEEDIDALLRGDFNSAIPESPYSSNELSIRAADGTFLGSLTVNAYDALSIFNEFGQHGGMYSTPSIFNQYGIYGSAYSTFSPYNQFSSQPPVIMRGDKVIAWLTKNTFLSPRIDPDMVKAFAKKHA